MIFSFLILHNLLIAYFLKYLFFKQYSSKSMGLVVFKIREGNIVDGLWKGLGEKSLSI